MKGFSTIELLTVLTTTAILATAAVPVYESVKKEASTVKSTADVRYNNLGSDLHKIPFYVQGKEVTFTQLP